MAKITHIFKTFYPDEPDGGIQEVIHQLGLMSMKHGYEVEVISLSKKPGVCDYDGIKCISYKTNIRLSSMPMSVGLMNNFSRIIKNTDIIHLHYPYPFAELLTLFHKTSKPIVITFHAPIEGRGVLMNGYAPFVKRLFKKASVIVPTSPNLASTESILNVCKDKIHPIGLWVSDERFNEHHPVEEEFARQVNEYGQFALFVGVLRTYKGLHYLLDAAKKVNKNILIAGRGPLFKELNRRIRDEDINNVHLLGYQSNEHVAYLFKKCSFVVLPSITRGECFGVVLLEACHYGKAMISTELGTGTSWVNTNETGFVIAPRDADVLAEKMNYLFDNSEQSRILGAHAQKRANELFSANSCGGAYLEIYDKLLK